MDEPQRDASAFTVELPDPTVARLSKLIQYGPGCGQFPMVELVAVAPGVHRSMDGTQARRVWIGVGFTHARGDCLAFMFTRSRMPLLGSFREWLYCVVPIVSNVHLDVDRGRCVFRWSKAALQPAPMQAVNSAAVGRRQTLWQGTGDCTIDDIRDENGVLEMLQDGYFKACQAGLTFHEGTRNNHREVWLFRDALPLELAKLQPRSILCRSASMRNFAPFSTGRGYSVAAKKTTNLTMICVTWNVGATVPIVEESLAPLLREEPAVDIVCVALQEVCQLSAKRLVADGDEWQNWRLWAEECVNSAYGGDLELLHESHLVGILTAIFVRTGYRSQVKNMCHCTVATGVGGVGGNKGAVCVRFEIGTVSMCFVNAHLAAGQANFIERCQHFQTIMERIRFTSGDPKDRDKDKDKDSQKDRHRSPSPEGNGERGEEQSLSSSGGLGLGLGGSLDQELGSKNQEPPSPTSGDGQTRDLRDNHSVTYELHDHEHIIWLGDTNSRLHWPGKQGGVPMEQARRRIQDNRIGELLALDQLNLMRRDGMAFDGFEELPIHFLPSYKWKPGGATLELRSQKHVPGWTDRILYRSMTRPVLEAHRYDMYSELRQSDHRPIFACFTVATDAVRPDVATIEEVNESVDADSQGGSSTVAMPAPIEVSVEPSELSFPFAKPGRPQERKVQITIKGDDEPPQEKTASGRWKTIRTKMLMRRFRVFVTSPTGTLVPLRNGLDARAGFANVVGSSMRSYAPVGVAAGSSSLLTRSLSATPSDGIIAEARPVELTLSANVQEGVTRAQTVETVVIIRIFDGLSQERHAILKDIRIVIRAVFEPSIFRAPLLSLMQLGHRPVLAGFGERESYPSTPSNQDYTSIMPPKEVVSAMQWLLILSRDAPPRMFDWWPDPLLHASSRGLQELSELQRYIENGWPLPMNDSCVPPRAASLFLLIWMDLLPEPILQTSEILLFATFVEAGIEGKKGKKQPTRRLTRSGQTPSAAGVEAVLKSMGMMPRSVLICVVELFAQLAHRHGERGDMLRRLASSLTHQLPPEPVVEQLLRLMLSSVKPSGAWPPLGALMANR
eukprot:TRINITY_DN16135_c0_g2_i1.p1 TRINITY_DN16135_c0_g2~~TRINITY_DN16135_c0_g2_i1.p1  ORF type:complete len:1070 (-),score=172.50 TRINITY_DN16135_c0_g2_i1:191-3400(-)